MEKEYVLCKRIKTGFETSIPKELASKQSWLAENGLARINGTISLPITNSEYLESTLAGEKTPEIKPKGKPGRKKKTI